MAAWKVWLFAVLFPVLWTVISAFVWGLTELNSLILDRILLFVPGLAALVIHSRHEDRRILIGRFPLLLLLYAFMFFPLFWLGFAITCATFGVCI